jgi:HlyD family secretion protein
MHMNRTLAFSCLSLLAAACSSHRQDVFQGYAEGEFVNVASSQSGHLEKLQVARGAQIAAGASLFSLESVQEQAALLQAQHQLAAAEAQLKDIKSGKRPVEVAVLSEQMAQAEVASQRSAQQRQRDEAQYRVGGISLEQLQATRAQADGDAARVRELQNQVEVARLPGRDEQLRAQADQVEVARAALTDAHWKLDQKVQTAPQAGMIFDTLYREGEWIAAGSPVVRILPPENIKVRFFVPQPILGSLAPGRAVNIHCDGCSADIPAAITFISPQAEFTPPIIYSNETRSKLVFMIEARPSTRDAPKLHPGQPLEVRLQ